MLVDTGSVYNIGTMKAWQRLHQLASPLVGKDDMVTFVSASGDDLGYTHGCVLDAQIGSDRHPVVMKVVTKMEESFSLLLGIDCLAALQGTIDFNSSHVQLRDCYGDPHSFVFEPVTPQKPLMASNLSRLRNRSWRPLKTISARLGVPRSASQASGPKNRREKSLRGAQPSAPWLPLLSLAC